MRRPYGHHPRHVDVCLAFGDLGACSNAPERRWTAKSQAGRAFVDDVAPGFLAEVARPQSGPWRRADKSLPEGFRRSALPYRLEYSHAARLLTWAALLMCALPHRPQGKGTLAPLLRCDSSMSANAMPRPFWWVQGRPS